MTAERPSDTLKHSCLFIGIVACALGCMVNPIWLRCGLLRDFPSFLVNCENLKMSAVRSTPEVKYELLSHTSSRPHLRWKEYAIICTCLISLIGVSYLMLYLAWGHLDDKHVDNLDFMMYGPSKTQLDFASFQERRAELYAKAIRNKEDYNLLDKVAMQKSKGDESISLNGPYVRSTPQPDGFKLVCYYALPSSSDMKTSKALLPENINASLCTHINMAFAGVSNYSIVPGNDHDIETYQRVVKLKERNPSLKVLLSVNGDLSSVIVNHTTRKAFIKTCISTLRQHNLDGLDIDWEFPNDPWSFMTLLAEFRKSFGNRYLLTAAVAAPQSIVDLSYKIDIMSRFVDWVNLMAYDFHHYTRLTPFTGLNAPLYSDVPGTGYMSQLNSNWSVLYWENRGMPRDKIVVGVPTYGHTFRLVNNENSNIGAPASGFGDIGGGGGFIDYVDVCHFLSRGATSVSDRSTRVPYAFKNSNWVSYDDDRSVAYKAEFVTSRGYAGVMIWSLNSDDHKGSCYNSGAKFPLTTRIKNVLIDDQL